MHIQQLRCFLAVAREAHFGRAAKRLHLSISPVSRAVKELERDLGSELFVRRYHQVELTTAGKHLLARLEPIVAELDLLRTEVRSLARAATRGLCIGGAPQAPAAVLDAVIEAAEKVDPNRPLQVTLAPSMELVPAVASGDIDLAVVHLDLTAPPHRPIDDLGLTSLQVAAYTMTVVMRADDPLADRTELRTADLAGRRYVVMVDSTQSAAIQRMRAWFATCGVDRIETVPPADVMMLVAKVRRRGSFTLVARENDMWRMFDGACFTQIPVVDVPSRGVGVVWRVRDDCQDGRIERIVSRLSGDGVEAG